MIENIVAANPVAPAANTTAAQPTQANNNATHTGVELGDAEQMRYLNLLKQLGQRFRHDRGVYHFKDRDGIAFTDKGKKLTSTTNESRAAHGMALLAKSKGWDSINVSGSEDFKRNMWLEASLQDINVTGYKPKDNDVEKLNELRKTKSLTPESKIVRSVAEKAIDSKVTDNQLREKLLNKVDETLTERQKKGATPKVKIYDRDAAIGGRPIEIEQPQVETNQERVR